MCNLANATLDKEMFLRIMTNTRRRSLPIGAVPRLAKSDRQRIVSRCGFLVSVVVGLLLLGAAPAAWGQVTFDGVVSILGTGSLTLNQPAGTAIDTAGNVYVSDYGHNQIVKVNPQGVASALAISGLSPGLSGPWGIAVDSAGTLYISDFGNKRIVKVSSSGSGSVVSLGSVSLSGPTGIAVDASGNIFIADASSNRIVEVPSVGAPFVLNITGLGATPLNYPPGVAVDTAGNLYIADYVNSRIVEVAAGGTAGTVLNITGLSSGLAGAQDVAVDDLGNLYIADYGNNRIVIVTPGGAGSVLSTGTVTLNHPYGVKADISGTVYIADTGDNQIVKVAVSAVGFNHLQLGTSTGTTQTLPFTIASGTTLGSLAALTVGTQSLDFTVATTGTTCTNGTTNTTCNLNIQFLPTAPGLRRGAVVLYDNASTPNVLLTVPLYGFGDSPVAALAPNTASVISTGGLTTSLPFQLALDGLGNMYVADYDSSNVTKVAAGGGSASVVSTGSESLGNVTGVVLDGAGNLFIADHIHSRIVVVTPGGVASELTINGLPTTPASGKVLYLPTEINFDGAGNLYISDWQNSRIVEVSSLAVAESTSSGNGTVIGTGSYVIGSNSVTGVAVDQKGTVYIADRTNNRVIQVTAAGAASLLSPTGFTFSNPQGVGVDGMGNIYVADSGNNRIVEITIAGVASVVSINGLPSPNTILGAPFGVTVDPSGNIYIPDWNNNRIVEVPVSGATLAFPSTAALSTSSPQTATVTNLGNQSLIFATNPSYTVNFSENLLDTNLCASGTSLSAGTVCDVSVDFTPQSVGSLSAGITVGDNALHTISSQQVSVSGMGMPASTVTAITDSRSGASVYGQPVTFTATVTSGTAAVTAGTVTFTDTTTSGTLATGVALNSSGQASVTLSTLTVGGHVIEATYNPDPDHSGSNNSDSFVVNPAALTITASSGAMTYGGTVPATSPGYGGFVNGDSASSLTTQPTCSTTATSSSPASPPTYASSCSGAVDPNYTINYVTGTLTVNKASPTISLVPSANPTPVFNSLTFTANVSSAASTPTGSVTFFDGTTQLSSGTLAGGVATYTTSSLAVGAHSITATYSGDANFLGITSSIVAEQINQINPTISWSPAPGVIYGATLSGMLNASALNGTSPVAGNFTYTATPSGGTASTVTSATVLVVGGYTLTANFTPSDTTHYTSVSANVAFTVNKASPTVLLVSSANPLLLTNSVTFTATVSSTASTPSGTISFYDGTTRLGSAETLAQGAATYTTSSLTLGTHSITVIYSGDANFASVASAALTETVEDFTLSFSPPPAGTALLPILPGGTATYAFQVGPSSGLTLPSAVTFSVSGLPAGAKATFTPQSLPAGAAGTNVTLVIQLANQILAHSPANPLGRGLALAMVGGMFLLPFGRKLRGFRGRATRFAGLLLLMLAATFAMLGLTACGVGGNGYFGQQVRNYTMTVTATSGALSHTTTVNLSVE